MLLILAKASCLLLSFVVGVVLVALAGSWAANHLDALATWLKRFI